LEVEKAKKRRELVAKVVWELDREGFALEGTRAGGEYSQPMIPHYLLTVNIYCMGIRLDYKGCRCVPVMCQLRSFTRPDPVGVNAKRGFRMTEKHCHFRNWYGEE